MKIISTSALIFAVPFLIACDRDPPMLLEPTEVQLGTVPLGSSVDFTVMIRNGAGGPLTIDRIASSCGCVSATWPSEPISSRAEGTIRGSLQCRSNNIYTVDLRIYTSKGIEVVPVTFQCGDAIRFDPQRVFFEGVRGGQEFTRALGVYARGDLATVEAAIASASIDSADLAISWERPKRIQTDTLGWVCYGTIRVSTQVEAGRTLAGNVRVGEAACPYAFVMLEK